MILEDQIIMEGQTIMEDQISVILQIVIVQAADAMTVHFPIINL